MQQKNRQHLLYGKLIALAQSQSTLDKNSDEMQHINKCPLCEDTYKYLVSYSSIVLNPKSHNSFEAFDMSTCPDSDMDYISFFLTFLNNKFPKEHAASLFKHLNICYPCFEKFVINWNAYVSVEMN